MKSGYSQLSHDLLRVPENFLSQGDGPNASKGTSAQGMTERCQTSHSIPSATTWRWHLEARHPSLPSFAQSVYCHIAGHLELCLEAASQFSEAKLEVSEPA